MLRTSAHNARRLQPLRLFGNSCGVLCAKEASLNRQAKIMGKLFGKRMPGSKKRWYPTAETGGGGAPATLFQASQFGKPSSADGGGKNSIRRMAVLNKLFMKHITDLLATGEASQSILGRGLQVTRVKISPDFAVINVYWLGSGESKADLELETELQRCAGLVRHDLSQLGVMGRVPRIQFQRDKTNMNIGQIEEILRHVDLGVEETASPLNYQTQLKKDEFFGKDFAERRRPPGPDSESDEVQERLPEMRHDVLGLDHRTIMAKIVAKMRTSKQAWDEHYRQSGSSPSPRPQLDTDKPSMVDSAAFQQFLAKTRDRARDHQKYSTTDGRDLTRQEETELNVATQVEPAEILSERQRLSLEEDFIHDDEPEKDDPGRQR